MSTMDEGKRQKRPRRSFTDEFKASAVRLVLEEGKSVSQVARDLDLTRVGAAVVGGPGTRRSHTRQDRIDHRGARGAGTTAQGKPHAEDGEGHSKKSGGVLRQGPDVRFDWIRAEDAYPKSMMCRVLAVSRSGLYASKLRPESERAREDRRLSVLVRAAHEAGRKTYGSPRVLRELRVQHQVSIGKNRIARLMRAEGLQARARRRYRCTTMSEHDQPIAPNLLGRNFQPPARNQSWASDTTELVTALASTTPTRRTSYSITSRSSITSSAGTRRSATSAPPSSRGPQR